MSEIIRKIVESWANSEGNVHTTKELLSWIQNLNESTQVEVCECSIEDDSFWFYDDYNGEILNRKRSFFSIKGIRLFEDDVFIKEQPIIFQPEIGYLGIICKEIDGVMNFLMQAKIEPGNINCVQISPTIQATKSNFTRVHGGNLPLYFEYFENSSRYNVIYDQIQSEQSSRFYHKRNRNMVVEVEDNIEEHPKYRWMTLGQIKELMKIDNLVNMDTRTVLSGIPISFLKKSKDLKKYFKNEALFNSIFLSNPMEYLPVIYQKINNYKMFHEVLTVSVPLNQLVNWNVDKYGVRCKEISDFEIKYYNITIEGREVKRWTQPLFKALGQAMFGLIMCNKEGTMKFLIKIQSEVGCFDKIELGPSIQKEFSANFENDEVWKVFQRHLRNRQGIMLDVTLSEEGGRFYHEQNRNVIMEIMENEIEQLPDTYIWVDFGTLNFLVQTNNNLNIQLRNLLSLLQM